MVTRQLKYKKMKKTLLITFIFTLSLFTVFAQHRGKRERIKAFKTAFITERLDLSPEEAEKFWPVYNQYTENIYRLKVVELRKEQNKIREKGGINALSDQEAKNYLQILIKNEKQLTNVKLKLFSDLKKILPPKKILLLHQAEHDFNRKLLEEYRRKHSSRTKGKK
jgi:hypothetical protein